MKTFLLLLSALALSQPPKGSNQIIIKPVSQEQVVRALQSFGYIVANDGYGILTTVPKRLASGGVMTITVKVKDSVATMSGIFEKKVVTPELFKFKESYGGHYLGGKFDSLIAIAKSLPAEISYSRQ